jgi:hypothetical protein
VSDFWLLLLASVGATVAWVKSDTAHAINALMTTSAKAARVTGHPWIAWFLDQVAILVLCPKCSGFWIGGATAATMWKLSAMTLHPAWVVVFGLGASYLSLLAYCTVDWLDVHAGLSAEQLSVMKEQRVAAREHHERLLQAFEAVRQRSVQVSLPGDVRTTRPD